MVAVVNATSVTVAVHLGFGHDPAGAVGAVVVTVYGGCGVGNGPEDPAAVNEKLWPPAFGACSHRPDGSRRPAG
jgi:hypothetical protein